MQFPQKIILIIVATLLSLPLHAEEIMEITGAWKGEIKSPNSKMKSRTVVLNFFHNKTVLQTSTSNITQGSWEQVSPNHFKATLIKLAPQNQTDPEHDPDIEQINFFFVIDPANQRIKGHWTQMDIDDHRKILTRGQFFGEKLSVVPLPYNPSITSPDFDDK